MSLQLLPVLTAALTGLLFLAFNDIDRAVPKIIVSFHLRRATKYIEDRSDPMKPHNLPTLPQTSEIPDCFPRARLVGNAAKAT